MAAVQRRPPPAVHDANTRSFALARLSYSLIRSCPAQSSRSMASYGLWVTHSATPLIAGTPAGAVHRCPTLTPFSPNAAVSVSQASASVPAAGAIHFITLERWPRKCVR